MSSHTTQAELCALFTLFIDGIKRLDKCLEFIAEVSCADYIPQLFEHHNTITVQQFIQYLNSHGIVAESHEVKDLISRLGGSDDKLKVKNLQDYLLPLGFVQKPEAESGYLRLFYEEVKLERAADEIRLQILKRWDYQCQALFKKLSNGSPNVDFNKFKKFFIRIRQPVADEDIHCLIRRIGNCETMTMSYVEFSQAMKTQKQRVNDRVDAPLQIVVRPQINYMDKLRKQHSNTPKSMTPTKRTETKRPHTPQDIHTPRELKELTSLMSLYLNQSRCLQNVLAQLEDVGILQCLREGQWEKQWSEVGVNCKGITYDKFMKVLCNFDERRPQESSVSISDLPVNALAVADNLFDLMREQNVQLQRAKLQFIREGSINLLERQFKKGHLDVLDVFSLLESASSNQVGLQDAELLIGRFNDFNGERVISRKVFLNELT